MSARRRLEIAAAPPADDRARAAEKRLADILRGLDLLAGDGDHAARHAAAILRGSRRAGRPAIDDGATLAEIAELEPSRGCGAVGIVARRHATEPKAIAALERRLRRKKRMK